MPTSQRVLVIGLDGATWDVLDPWIRAGSLPNLGRLRQSGSWGVLRSTLPPISAPAWSTFMTGKGPGKHGVFHFIDHFDDGSKGNTSRPALVNARSIRSSTLWDWLGHHGRTVVVINVPMTYPPRPVNGALISGLLTPRGAPTFTYPPELSGELRDYVIDLDHLMDTPPFAAPPGHRVDLPLSPLLEQLADMLDKRARTSLALMSSYAWDLFLVVFIGPDRLGHHLWPYHRSPDANDPPEVQALCRGVHDYYVRLDEVVGRLVDATGDDTTTMVMSDHGMGPESCRRVHLSNWLQQRGWLCAEPVAGRGVDRDRWLRRLGLTRDRVGRLVARVPGLIGSDLIRQVATNRDLRVDEARSQAYGVPIRGAEYITGIRISPAASDREALCQEIMAGLSEIVDPATGVSPVQWVAHGEDCYHGPHIGPVPEILAGMDPDYAWAYDLGHYSSLVTRQLGVGTRGRHRLEGICLLSGSDVAQRSAPLANLDIEDLAPTILYLLGLPVPSDLDGRVLDECLMPGLLNTRPITYGEPLGFWPDQEHAEFSDAPYVAGAEEEIVMRLRALGYVD